MQKKLIALAIAGLSGAAFAQSNVTIYGVMDATYDNVSATGATAGAGNNLNSRGRTTMNSSYIGFKGVESLGNGLAVAWQVEQSVGENAGATNTVAGSTYGLANRDTYIGLAGGFGTIAAGTLTAPARALGAAMDVNSGATGIGANTALIGKLGGGSGAGYFDQRFANAIAYISPNMGGFSGVLAYVPNENRSADTAFAANGTGAKVDTTGWTLGLNYNNGPIMVGYAWTQLKDKNAQGNNTGAIIGNGVVGGAFPSGLGLITGAGNAGVATGVLANIEKATNNRLAVKYDFGAGTVGLLWDQSKANVVGLTAATAAASVSFPGSVEFKQTVWYLPVTFNVGSGKIIAQYGHANKLKVAGADVADSGAKHVELGYEYSLSKRTTVKALWSQLSNDANASYDFLYGVAAPNTTAPGYGVGAGSDPRGFSVGLRHSF